MNEFVPVSTSLVKTLTNATWRMIAIEMQYAQILLVDMNVNVAMGFLAMALNATIKLRVL